MNTTSNAAELEARHMTDDRERSGGAAAQNKGGVNNFKGEGEGEGDNRGIEQGLTKMSSTNRSDDYEDDYQDDEDEDDDQVEVEVDVQDSRRISNNNRVERPRSGNHNRSQANRGANMTGKDNTYESSRERRKTSARKPPLKNR
jgi:hypothetical protein